MVCDNRLISNDVYSKVKYLLKIKLKFPPWVYYLCIVLGLFLVWMDRDKRPQIKWLVIGLIIGIIALIVMLALKHKDVTHFLYGIQLIASVMSVFSWRINPGILGMALGLNLPNFLVIVCLQAIRRKILTWNEISELYGIEDSTKDAE